MTVVLHWSVLVRNRRANDGQQRGRSGHRTIAATAGSFTHSPLAWDGGDGDVEFESPQPPACRFQDVPTIQVLGHEQGSLSAHGDS